MSQGKDLPKVIDKTACRVRIANPKKKSMSYEMRYGKPKKWGHLG